MTGEIRTTENRLQLMLISDIHLDNKKCKRRLLKKHLELAREIGAIVMLGGDTLCLMNGNRDNRGDKMSLQKQQIRGPYYDMVLDDAAKFLAPYADMIAFVGHGNHETTWLKYHDTDPVRGLVDRLKPHGFAGFWGGYQQYIYIVMTSPDGSRVRKNLIYFHHGKYGGEVTKGILGTNRYGVSHPDAHIVWSGHTHDSFIFPLPQMRVDARGKVVNTAQMHIKTGTYKEELVEPFGWAVEKIVMPKFIGCALLDFRVGGGGSKMTMQPMILQE